MRTRVVGGRNGRGALLGRSAWAGVVAALALVAAAMPACSVVVDGSAQQCSSNDECADFPGTECSDGICKTPDIACVTNVECGGVEGGACIGGVCLANQNDCASTADCGGEDYVVCKRPIAGKRECVSLLSAECTLVEGDWASDQAVFIGSVLPTAGQSNTGTGIATQNGARLAIREIAENASGLPPLAGGARRPLVQVSCNDESDKEKAVTAARYLVDTVGVQAIIGASFSGITLEVANKVTIPAGVLLFSPSATSTAITDLADQDPSCLSACAGDAACIEACPGLVWRSSPNDEFQSAALAAFMPILENRIREQLSLLSTDDIKVALLHKGDSYGQGISQALESQLRFNDAGATASANADNYVRFNYGNPDESGTPLRYAEAIDAAKQLGAHVIFDLGTDESIEDVLVPLEAQWDIEEYRPYYVLGDGGFVAETLIYGVEHVSFPTEDVENPPARAEADQDDLRKRIFGSVPGTSAEQSEDYRAFLSSYRSTFSEGSPETFGAAGAYDITYLLAFAYAAARDQPQTGTNLARGLLRTVPPGTTIRVGPSAINTGFGIMTNPGGGNMDFRGASGQLDFDVATGEAVSDVLIWCMSESSSGNNQVENESGIIYVAADSAISGSDADWNCN